MPDHFTASEPCGDFRPAIPLAYADSLCRCGASRTGNSHGDGYIRTIDITGVWTRVVAEHNAQFHPGEQCPDPDKPCQPTRVRRVAGVRGASSPLSGCTSG